MATPIALVIAPEDDGIAAGTAAMLVRLGVPTRSYAPSELALLKIELTDRTFKVEGAEVGAIVWRVRPDTPLSDGVEAADRAFSDAETAATWLAAMQLPTILAINRFDAETWYGRAGWLQWRHRLRAAGVPIVPMAFGDGALADDWVWSPYTAQYDCALPEDVARASMGTAARRQGPLEHVVSVCGNILGGVANHDLAAAAALLDACGVRLAAISCDASGRVHHVDPLPVLIDAAMIDQVSRRLGDTIHEDWRSR